MLLQAFICTTKYIFNKIEFCRHEEHTVHCLGNLNNTQFGICSIIEQKLHNLFALGKKRTFAFNEALLICNIIQITYLAFLVVVTSSQFSCRLIFLSCDLSQIFFQAFSTSDTYIYIFYRQGQNKFLSRRYKTYRLFTPSKYSKLCCLLQLCTYLRLK